MFMISEKVMFLFLDSAECLRCSLNENLFLFKIRHLGLKKEKKRNKKQTATKSPSEQGMGR